MRVIIFVYRAIFQRYVGATPFQVHLRSILTVNVSVRGRQTPASEGTCCQNKRSKLILASVIFSTDLFLCLPSFLRTSRRARTAQIIVIRRNNGFLLCCKCSCNVAMPCRIRKWAGSRFIEAARHRINISSNPRCSIEHRY